MKPLYISESNTYGLRRSKIVTYTAIALCFLASWADTVATQKTGDPCRLKTGEAGVCQLLPQCATAVHKAASGEMPTICTTKEQMPIVCCERPATIKFQVEDAQNFIKKQSPQQFTSQYYLFDNETREKPLTDFHARYPRQDGDRAWWLAGHVFSENPSAGVNKPQSSNSDNNHGISRPGNSQNPWLPQRPASANPLSPPSANPIPKPVDSTNRLKGDRRISEIKCNAYARLATDQVTTVPLVSVPESVSVDVPKCDFNNVPLIVGGEEAQPKEFPHMVALGYLENGIIDWKCGGSLISENFVLTAAHCIATNNRPTTARMGALNLKSFSEGVKPVNYLVVDVIRHPDYKAPSKYNDIALVKIDPGVKFSESIRPACLYTSNNFEVNKTVATGWGKIDYAEKKSDVLLKVVLSIIDNNVCSELYQSDQGSKQLKNGIASSMMCAGELRGGKDTCQGDSGGPIQITRPQNRCTYSIIGITSFGKFCAAKNSPGVYTRVSSFVPWIESIVWPEG